MPTASPISRMTSLIDSSTAMNWLGIAIRPVVAKTARDREQQRNERRDRGAEHEQEDDQRQREGDHRGLASMLLNAASVAFVVVTLPSWLTVKPSCAAAVLSTAALILSM